MDFSYKIWNSWGNNTTEMLLLLITKDCSQIKLFYKTVKLFSESCNLLTLRFLIFLKKQNSFVEMDEKVSTSLSEFPNLIMSENLTKYAMWISLKTLYFTSKLFKINTNIWSILFDDCAWNLHNSTWDYDTVTWIRNRLVFENTMHLRINVHTV